ncbi:MAG: hypothetical protein GF383_00995 [Candidatus Lokiarchaeota archaeon]|nr:hypothetical protein [Candidatus Lokiarchaeota archaeon]MBD3337790.1 hypothetical protein [Candidatus Lokiarchaeota archaeon]
MPSLNAFDIFFKFENNELDKSSALLSLKSILENQDNGTLRIEALQIIGILKPQGEEMFTILEQTLISDNHSHIRALAAKIIIENFPERSYEPIKWALERKQEHFFLNFIACVIQRSKRSDLQRILSSKNVSRK